MEVRGMCILLAILIFHSLEYSLLQLAECDTHFFLKNLFMINKAHNISLLPFIRMSSSETYSICKILINAWQFDV